MTSSSLRPLPEERVEGKLDDGAAEAKTKDEALLAFLDRTLLPLLVNQEDTAGATAKEKGREEDGWM